ncbi:retinoid-inducible serine carboxypeptidase-like [Sitophilus oryzae]|uniref:Retinoid-inducible serine carboxypeptidase n=1 Tax=Sitophilus oryzae TaxID=7048 RepID=A0A6J2Y9S3_SITOR|nr:retinoid-inducible serine carboxypeptidase-like [Sitophilus oryzae]
MMKSYFILILIVKGILGRGGFGPTDQEWGFSTVREGAHIFWWLHYTTATQEPTEKPLLIWLQGGPGSSSTSYGNFAELGPLDLDLNPRNTSWVNSANVLFVDNPVGTGFSYVENDTLFTTTNAQIADDFVVFLQDFYKVLPQFETVPLYIFCESYGGKMTAQIALHLIKAIENGSINSNFKGVGLGDSWISPIDSSITWAPYLYQLGVIDTQQYENLDAIGQHVKQLVDDGEWYDATEAWFILQNELYSSSGFCVDFYNVLTPCDAINDTFTLKKPQGKVLGLSEEEIMNDKVRIALNISRTWGEQSNDVFTYLETDFMKPVTEIVERLLNETDIKVGVYNGQLDLIVDTPGTIKWVDALNFKGSEEWSTNEKSMFSINGIYEGYEKKAGNLYFYWILRAGHMVPRDNPNGMLYILEQITDNFAV